MSQPGLAGVYLSVHTPRYCTYDAAFAGTLAHPNFQAVRDGSWHRASTSPRSHPTSS